MLTICVLVVIICMSEAEKCFQEKEAKLINGIKASIQTMQEKMKGVHQMVQKLEVNIKGKVSPSINSTTLWLFMYLFTVCFILSFIYTKVVQI